jgi:hypothetical protein
VVTHPGGTAAAGEDVDAVVSPSTRQSAGERLAVYAHAYWARLLECLREEFPMLRAAVGDEAFDALAVDYLLAFPSQSYTLGDLASRFADQLAATRPDDDFSKACVDLARFERAVGEVFDAPGGETLGFLTAEQLAALPADRRGEIRLLPLPTFCLLQFEYDVNAWFTRLRDDAADAAPPERGPAFVALSRRAFIVRRKPLSAAQYYLLVELRGGATLARALEIVTTEHPDAIEEIAASLGSWCTDWAAAGFFRGVTVC